MDARWATADVSLLEDGNHDDVVDARGPERTGGATDEHRKHAEPGIVVSGRQDTRVHADGRSAERLRHLHASARWGPQAARADPDEILGGIAQVLAERSMAGVFHE